MTKDEALDLALEALESTETKDHRIQYGIERKAITAIKQARSAPVQEPVAWMIWTHGPVLVFMNKDEANLEFDRLNHAYPEPTRMLVPLYAHPQAREPLTSEQVAHLWAFKWTGDREAFIRAIEAAHGIKENT